MTERPPDDEIRVEPDPPPPEVKNVMSVTSGVIVHRGAENFREKFILISRLEIVLGIYFTIFGIVILVETVIANGSENMGEYLGVMGSGIYLIVCGCAKISRKTSTGMLRIFMLMSLLAAAIMVAIIVLQVLYFINMEEWKMSTILRVVLVSVSFVSATICFVNFVIYRLAIRAPKKTSEAMLYTDVSTGEQFIQMNENEKKRHKRRRTKRSSSNPQMHRPVPVSLGGGNVKSKSSSDLKRMAMMQQGASVSFKEPEKSVKAKRHSASKVPPKSSLYQNYRMPESILAEGKPLRDARQSKLPPYQQYADSPQYYQMPPSILHSTSTKNKAQKRTRFADENLQLAVISDPHKPSSHYHMPQGHYGLPTRHHSMQQAHYAMPPMPHDPYHPMPRTPHDPYHPMSRTPQNPYDPMQHMSQNPYHPMAHMSRNPYHPMSRNLYHKPTHLPMPNCRVSITECDDPEELPPPPPELMTLSPAEKKTDSEKKTRRKST